MRLSLRAQISIHADLFAPTDTEELRVELMLVIELKRRWNIIDELDLQLNKVVPANR